MSKRNKRKHICGHKDPKTNLTCSEEDDFHDPKFHIARGMVKQELARWPVREVAR